MRKLLKTQKGCLIYQMYCELGHIPERFDIYKIRMFYSGSTKNKLYLKDGSTSNRKSDKEDWVPSCVKNMKNLEINISFKNIEEISVYRDTQLVKQKCKEGAYKYEKAWDKRKGDRVSKVRNGRLPFAKYHLNNPRTEKII